MPSILTQYENVDFIAGKNFIYNGVEYRMGDDAPEAKTWGNLENLIRARRLIPVVDDYSKDAPFQFRRTVLTRELALRKLGLGDRVKDQKEPVTLTSTPAPEEGEFNPANHTIDGVMEYVEENPDEVLSVYALEEEGKNRPRLLAKLDEILNQQAEAENEEDTNV